MEYIHLIPQGDIVNHSAGKSSFCICNPKAEIDQDPLGSDYVKVIHFPMDGRPEVDKV